MSVVPLTKPNEDGGELAQFLDGFSIEVMPRTAAKIDDFRALLPAGTRIYVAHIDGTPFEDMLQTVKRLAGEGFTVMPHLPARSVKDAATLDTWLGRYKNEAGVHEALVLAGGIPKPTGDFHSSMQLIETGLFDKHGFDRLHVAGHPEGNKDIDPKGGSSVVDDALLWKQGYRDRTDAQMAIATQFAFDSKTLTNWAERIQAMGVTLPIHVGVAGPAKLQTLIKFSIACGVGPSLSVLKKRARDLTKLLLPFEPTDVLTELAAYKTAHPESLIAGAHVFPLGGIKTSATWVDEHT